MGRRHRLISIFAALLVALLALPAFAQASGQDVIRDCYDDGHIDGNYSQGDYQDAQDNLPSDVDQYSDCRDVIAQGQAGGGKKGSSSGSGHSNGSGGGGSNSGGSSGSGASGGSSSGSSGSSRDERRGGSPKPNAGNAALETKSGAYAETEADKAAYESAKAQAAQGGALPGGLAIPAAGDFSPAKANTLPLPVVLALAAVGLLVVATSVLVARKRLPALNRVVPSRFRSS
jgi:hypothetical protein